MDAYPFIIQAYTHTTPHTIFFLLSLCYYHFLIIVQIGNSNIAGQDSLPSKYTRTAVQGQMALDALTRLADRYKIRNDGFSLSVHFSAPYVFTQLQYCCVNLHAWCPPSNKDFFLLYIIFIFIDTLRW